MSEQDEEGRGEVILVGTSHISEKSVEEVEETIDEEEPDVVAVELDEQRYKSMKGDGPDEIEAKDLIQGNKPFEFFVYWLMSYLQTRMGDRFGIEPGADMMAAVETAEGRGIPVALVDRDINITIARLWAKMKFLEKLKFVGALVLGLVGFGLGRVEEEEEIDIEEIAQGDMVETLIEEFRAFSPQGAEALIDERDAFIASKLVALREADKKVVAVIGAGHRAGIQAYLDNPETIPDIEEISSTGGGRRFSIFKIVGYLISIFVVVMFILLFMAGADNRFLAELAFYWFIINGVPAFLGAMLGGAHLPSALVGGGLAWMTSINPALAPGWFAGYVELRYRDISVTDIDEINEILADVDASARELISRIYGVDTFKLLLVVALTNLGSIIGTFFFLFVVLPVIGADVDMTEMLRQGMTNSWNQIVDLVVP